MPLSSQQMSGEDLVRLFGAAGEQAAAMTPTGPGNKKIPQAVIPWYQFTQGGWNVPEGYVPVTNPATGQVVRYEPADGNITDQNPVYMIGPSRDPGPGEWGYDPRIHGGPDLGGTLGPVFLAGGALSAGINSGLITGAEAAIPGITTTPLAPTVAGAVTEVGALPALATAAAEAAGEVAGDVAGDVVTDRVTDEVTGGLDWMDWVEPALGLASAIFGNTGGGDTLPEWIKPYSMDILERSQAMVDTPYSPYTGQAIAPMSGNEQTAYDIAAARGALHGVPGFDYMGSARSYADRSAREFPGTDMSQYMDPYIMAALDPAAREMEKAFMLDQQRLQDSSVARGAFGGSRGALLESENFANYLTRRGDLYKTGLSDAWTRGTNLWQADRDAAARASGQYGALAGLDQNMRNADLAALRDTGALSRGIDQAQNTFDYEQFREGRDWGGNQLDQYATRVGSVRTGEQIPEADRTGQIIGALATGVGALNRDEGP